MLARAEAKKQRKQLKKEIEREHKAKARAELEAFRARLREVSGLLGARLEVVREGCREARAVIRERWKEKRREALAPILAAAKAEREQARAECHLCKTKVREEMGTLAAQRRAELAAERRYQQQIGETAKRTHTKRTRLEVLSESDDAVRVELPPDLLPLFERVKRQIKGSERQSRTEAFLKYAEEHPREVLEALEDETERAMRDLERQRDKAERRAPRKTRPRYTAAELAAVPF
jgi:hypothetical protein